MPKALSASRFALRIEYYREEDGRWLADIPALPGVTAYGQTKKQATAAVQAVALEREKKSPGRRNRLPYKFATPCGGA